MAMSWDVRFFWTSTLWRQKADTVQTPRMSLHPESLSDVPDLAVSVLNFSFSGLVHVAQFSATSSPVLFKSGSTCTAVTVLLILLPYILILCTGYCKLWPVLSSLSFSPQNQVMLQQKSIPPQFEDHLLVIKGITVVARQLPRPQFSSLSLISKTFKHMFTCRLMIISLRVPEPCFSVSGLCTPRDSWTTSKGAWNVLKKSKLLTKRLVCYREGPDSCSGNEETKDHCLRAGQVWQCQAMGFNKVLRTHHL